jgi:hypothetical protein
MNMKATDLRILFAGAALFFAMAALATVIYRWVDDNGQTQISDAVPEKYKKSATRTDSSRFEISPERKQQAEDRLARDKALAEEAAKRRQSVQPADASSAASQPTGPARARQTVTDATDCDTWRRLYRESLECFAPYRTTRGTTKAEAFEHCTPIPSPELKCGPDRE